MEKIKVTRVFEGTESVKSAFVDLVLKRIDSIEKDRYTSSITQRTPAWEAGESA